MPWPTVIDYQEALQNPKLSFADPELRDSTIVVDRWGIPEPISGSFACVYRVNCNGRRHAVRCLLRDYPDIEKRYALISEHLRLNSLPCMVEFNFQKQGIRVKGKWYPILKMEWAEGDPLNDYLQKHINNREEILELAQRFLALAKDLRQSSIAHGDLQHGNILISNGMIRLVDYDGMFVPTMRGMHGIELGQRNYQHPFRTERDFDLYIDNFSEWCIYLSLLALGTGTKVPNVANIGSDNILFRKEDFENPGSSELFRALEQATDVTVQSTAILLGSFVYTSDLSQIPPLDSSQIPVYSSPLDLPTKDPLPAWMAGLNIETSQKHELSSDLFSAGVEISWVADHTEPLPLIKISGPFRVDRYLLFGSILALLIFGLFILFGAIIASISITFIGLGLSFIAVATPVLYLPMRFNRFAVTKEKQEILTRLNNLGREVRESEGKIKQLFSELASLGNKQRTQMKDIADRQRKSFENEKRELNETALNLQKALAGIHAQKQKLNQSYTAEIQAAIKALQDQLLTSKLERQDILSADIRGIGRVMKRRLADKGILTAADISDIYISTSYYGQYSGQTAYIVVPGKGKINVEGIGPAKAKSLMDWKRNVESAIRANLPNTLPALQQKGIHAKYDAEIRSLERQEPNLKQGATRQEETIKQEHREERSLLAKKLTNLPREFEQQRQAQLQKVEEKKRELVDWQWKASGAQKKFEAYKNVSFLMYLKQILFLTR